MTTKYEVGQVLFVLDTKNNKILPCQVIEENTRKTLNGDVVSYKVIFGVDPKNVMDIESINSGEIYTSLHEVRRILTENVNNWVNKHVLNANKASVAWYKHDALQSTQNLQKAPQQEQNIQTLPDLPLDDSDESNLVELPNGQVIKAKVKVTSR